MTKHQLSSLNQLLIEVEQRTTDFNNKRSKNHKNYSITSKGQILASAITTLLIAINMKLNLPFFAFLAIIASALSSIFGSFLAKYMYSERLSNDINTVCLLKELKFDISLHIEKEKDDPEKYKITIKDVEEYKVIYQEILDQANSDWQKNMKLRKKEK